MLWLALPEQWMEKIYGTVFTLATLLDSWCPSITLVPMRDFWYYLFSENQTSYLNIKFCQPCHLGTNKMCKTNKTARIRVNNWMFRLPFKVYGAAITRKKLNEIKKDFFLIWDFSENHYPTRQIKFEVINFAPSNKSIMENKFRSTNLERFLRQVKSPLTH